MDRVMEGKGKKKLTRRYIQHLTASCVSYRFQGLCKHRFGLSQDHQGGLEICECKEQNSESEYTFLART